MHPAQDANAVALQPLVRSVGWIRFLGVMSIIMGVFAVLSIWGILIAWIPIWFGSLLMQTANHLDNGTYYQGMESLAKSLKLQGILIIIYIAIFVLAIGLAIALPLMTKLAE
ncbi:MAG: hypothetical protein H6510_16200 [Acidobacteria bacterium]|nr:hypothetical protein [Acidobacteriota bacterium]MCB9399355.1 hypothetical protein [Acidobacteriota bacterium]